MVTIAALLLLHLVGRSTWAGNPSDPPTANANDPYAVPAGNAQVVAAFLQKLMQERPQNAEEATKIRQAALQAADKLLAAKPSNEQLTLAVKAKSSVLQDPKELAAFEEEMKKAGKKPAARIVHMRLLTVKLDQAHSDVVAFRKELEEVKQFFGDGKQMQPGDEQLARHAGEAAEGTGDNKLTGETYDEMASLMPKQMPFSQVAKDLQACGRRWKLVGNPMKLEGRSLEGKALSLTSYKGKVVLVDFWATWCGPCKAEIPNMKRVYTDFHDKGFEVVGISIDQGAADKLKEFVQKEEIPWTICRDGDTPGKNAEYYGIHRIPQMILVGRDGKVISLNARGAGLGPLVEKAIAAPATGAGEMASASDEAGGKKEKGKLKGEETAAKKKAGETPKASAVASRTWNDASGKFSVAAKFRGIINKSVKLECEDGRVITVPLAQLSDDDQAYIKKRRAGGTP
jgi:thiol-disulfide isomerase/thioredoxin